jgi:hypothetical protein
MTFADWKKLFIDNLASIVILLVILVPSIWAVSSWFHSGQISSLSATIETQKESLAFLQMKLKDCSEAKEDLAEALKTQAPAKTDSIWTPTAPNIGGYPVIKNPAKLTRLEVHDLANFYELTRKWPVNPQLQFDDGDISYWYQRGLSEQELRKHFEARRLILQSAEKSGRKIPTKSDLSALAEQIVADL